MVMAPPPGGTGSSVCPECGEPIVAFGALRLIGLHRNSFGKRCEASGRSLIHHNYRRLLHAIFGTNRRDDA